MRQLINHLDPYHPTFTLSNLPSAMPNYIVSGDIFMYDPYPIRSKRNSAAKEISAFRENIHKGGVPCWAVNQIFNWGIHRVIHASNPGKEKLENYLDPTAVDMRSMMMISLLDGATGIVPWVYPFPWQDATWKRFRERGMGDYPQKHWEKIKAAASAVKLLSPYLIADQDNVPAIKIEDQGKGKIRAKLYRDAKGKYALVIVGCGDGVSKGIITLPAGIKLKSVYGNTRDLGQGKYLFTSPDLDSDILIENP